MNPKPLTEIIFILLVLICVTVGVLVVLYTYDPNPKIIGVDVLNDCKNMAYATGECIFK